jgi:hypothetical protein
MSDHGEYAVGAMLTEIMMTDTFAYVFIKQGFGGRCIERDWHAPVRGLAERPSLYAHDPNYCVTPWTSRVQDVLGRVRTCVEE